MDEAVARAPDAPLPPSRREILRIDRISSACDRQAVLKSARLNLLEGEIVGLAGLNDSGKTTLVGVAAGFTTQYEGTFLYLGKPTRLSSAEQAKRLGIYYIEQQSMLLDRLTIEENMLLAPGRGSSVLLHRAEGLLQVKGLFSELDLRFDLDAPAGSLTFYQKFLVELTRDVLSGAKVIIVDGVLGDLSAQMLESARALFRKLAARGIGLVLVGTGIRQLEPCCDRLFVMRGGMTVGILPRSMWSEDLIVSMMLGHDVKGSLRRTQAEPPPPGREVLMAWEQVYYKGVLRGIDFEVCRGEILGVLNVNKGSGAAIAEVLTEAQDEVRGRICFEGRPLDYLTTDRTRARGIAVMGEDCPLFPNLSLEENIGIAALEAHTRLKLFINRRTLRYQIGELIDAFLRSDAQPFLVHPSLSDDRLFRRKVALCRTLISGARLVVMMHPTLNMDALMAEQLAADILKTRRMDVTQMIVSTDAEFLLGVCSRILIVNHGVVESAFSITGAAHGDVMRQYGDYIKGL